MPCFLGTCKLTMKIILTCKNQFSQCHYFLHCNPKSYSCAAIRELLMVQKEDQQQAQLSIPTSVQLVFLYASSIPHAPRSSHTTYLPTNLFHYLELHAKEHHLLAEVAKLTQTGQLRSKSSYGFAYLAVTAPSSTRLHTWRLVTKALLKKETVSSTLINIQTVLAEA